jgi:hypothetical protein
MFPNSIFKWSIFVRDFYFPTNIELQFWSSQSTSKITSRNVFHRIRLTFGQNDKILVEWIINKHSDHNYITGKLRYFFYWIFFNCAMSREDYIEICFFNRRWMNKKNNKKFFFFSPPYNFENYSIVLHNRRGRILFWKNKSSLSMPRILDTNVIKVSRQLQEVRFIAFHCWNRTLFHTVLVSSSSHSRFHLNL